MLLALVLQHCIQNGVKTEDYTKGDAFQAEKRTLFATEWLPLCAEAQLAKPGDFLSASVGGWSVFGVRGKDGGIRVLRNACRHQNMPVVSTPTGTCESFRCRFHGWTYGLDGKFIGAPPPVAPADPASPDLHLQVLTSEIRSGLVLFSMGAVTAAADIPDIERPHTATTTTEIACNWKVAVEELLLSLSNFTWHWPLLAVRNGGGATIVEQVVPFTFLRTRLMTHVFGPAPEGLKPALEAFKQACEQRQVSGAAANQSKQVLLFHRHLADAYAKDQPA